MCGLMQQQRAAAGVACASFLTSGKMTLLNGREAAATYIIQCASLKCIRMTNRTDTTALSAMSAQRVCPVPRRAYTGAATNVQKDVARDVFTISGPI